MKSTPTPAPQLPADSAGSGNAYPWLEQREQSIRVILLVLSVIIPVITFALYNREGLSLACQVTMALWVVVLGLLVMLKLEFARHIPVLLTAAVMLTGIVGAVADGSVHSPFVLVMLAAVVGTGIYLSHKAMILSAAVAIIALALLNVAVQKQWLKTTELSTDWALWLTQSAVVLCLLVVVLHDRRRLERAYRVQERALQQSEAAMKAMAQSETLFATIFRNNPAASLAQNFDNRFVMAANDEFLRLLGYQLEDLIGQVPPPLWADPQQLSQFRHQLETEGRVHAMQAQGLRADGSQFDALVFSEIVDLQEKQLVITMFLDMSAEISAKAALDKSEQRFAKAFNVSPLGMAITRLSNGQFLEVNPAVERMIGYAREDLIGKSASESGIWLSERDRQNYLLQLRTHERVMGYESLMCHKQGRNANMRIWSERIEIDNEECNLSFMLNVDEEKRREAMLMNIAQGVSGETGEAFFRTAVQALANATGAYGVMVADLQTPDKLHSVALYCDGQHLPSHKLQVHDTPFEQVLQKTGLVITDSALDPRLLRCPTVTSQTPHLFGGVALRDQDGTAIGLLGAFWREHDDTSPDLHALMAIFASRCNAELVRLHRDRALQQLQDTLEQRVADRTAQLELLNRELDTFAYSVSHDLKSPLRAIDGFTHILKEQLDGRLTPEDEEIIDRVMSSTQRMNSLINDLLGLARVSQTQLQRSWTNLSDIAADVVRQEKHRNPERKVAVQIAPDLMADCDPRLAQIVLENLIGNAWKYTRNQPSAVIRIEAGESTPEGATSFSVDDNGAGFDMARANRIFQPFTRLHTEKEFEGSGVGLATVRRIVERHGGEIQAKAEPGQGANFWVTFGQQKAV